jgi:tol-pal system protein YbgF
VLKLYALLLLGLFVVAPAKAGLFADDDARAQIQQLELRVKQLDARAQMLEDSNKQQVKSMLDLQSQIEALNGEIRKLRGQNEETAHGLQDAEKRQKDFYVDLDTRVRHFETAEEAAKEAAEKTAKEAVAASAVPVAATIPVDPSDPVPEDRAFEAAYGFFKGGNHEKSIKAFQEFLKKYPDSVHAPNASYWLGRAQFLLKDYKGALTTYEGALAGFPGMPKAADTLFDIAACQQGLKRPVTARKTLKQLIAKYPASEAAAKAKKLLAAAK